MSRSMSDRGICASPLRSCSRMFFSTTVKEVSPSTGNCEFKCQFTCQFEESGEVE